MQYVSELKTIIDEKNESRLEDFSEEITNNLMENEIHELWEKTQNLFTEEDKLWLKTTLDKIQTGSEIELTQKEEEEFLRLEAQIHQGLSKFYDIGNALKQIKEKKLYKLEYVSFEDYLKKRWGFTKQHAYKLISAVEIADSLHPSLPKPSSENLANVLGNIKDVELRQEVWEKAVETKEKPTLQTIKNIQKEYHHPQLSINPSSSKNDIAKEDITFNKDDVVWVNPLRRWGIVQGIDNVGCYIEVEDSFKFYLYHELKECDISLDFALSVQKLQKVNKYWNDSNVAKVVPQLYRFQSLSSSGWEETIVSLLLERMGQISDL